MITSVFVTSSPTAPFCPVFGIVRPFQRRMIAHAVRRVAVRHLPQQFAAIELDGGEHAVRRLHDRQPLHREPAGRKFRRALPPFRKPWLSTAAAGAPAPLRRLCDRARRIRCAAVAWSEHFDERLAATPRTYLMSENPGGGVTSECELMPAFDAGANATCVSGS